MSVIPPESSPQAVLLLSRGAFPHPERAADTSLALPIFAEVTEAQQSAVVNEVVRPLRL